MKTKEKEEILKECGFGSLKAPNELRIRYYQLEVLIDTRDLLGAIKQELNELNKSRILE